MFKEFCLYEENKKQCKTSEYVFENEQGHLLYLFYQWCYIMCLCYMNVVALPILRHQLASTLSCGRTRPFRSSHFGATWTFDFILSCSNLFLFILNLGFCCNIIFLILLNEINMWFYMYNFKFFRANFC